MKSKFVVFASSLFLLLGVWYVSTQDSRAGVEDKKEKKSIEAAHSDHVEDVVGKKAFAEVLKNNDIVLVDFHATWCPPCRQLKPTIYGIANKYHDNVKVAAVDTDKNPDLARSHGVSGIPDVRLFQDGKQVHKWIGLQPAANYTSKIDAILKQKAGEEKSEEAPAKSEKPQKEETES